MGFYIFLSVLIFLCCLLLAIIVLIQNPKGGGLSSTFGGSANNIMGVRRTADFLEKATWTLAIALVILCLISSFAIPRGQSGEADSSIQSEVTVEDDIAPQVPQMPADMGQAPAPAPQQ